MSIVNMILGPSQRNGMSLWQSQGPLQRKRMQSRWLSIQSLI